MLRERVSNNIYVFTSELYAQVTAGAIVTPEGAILIDTLPYPVETRQILQFIEEGQGIPVRYVVNTHYHADHTYGSCLFRHAEVVSHALCRELLDERGRAGLVEAQAASPELAEIEVRLPGIVFDDGILNLHLGGVTLQMWHAPGHSPDSIVCLVKEGRVLFATDVLMPIPFFTDGSWDDYVNTLQALLPMSFENVIQGHGEVILRGEVSDKIKSDLHYLNELRRRVERIVKQRKGPQALASVDIESCGKSRVPLNGLVQQLHASNINALYNQLLQAS
jgi:cyclase